MSRLMNPAQRNRRVAELRELAVLLEAMPVRRECGECIFFDKGNCQQWHADVPVEQRAAGCDAWEEDIPF